jgi:AmiR/NasT family two-component response regulator
MQVWLLENQSSEGSSNLQKLLHQLEKRPDVDLRLVGVSAFQPDSITGLCQLVRDPLDVLVINEPVLPEGPAVEEVFNLGLAMVVVTTAEGVKRFPLLATHHPVIFALSTLDEEGLWLALQTALASRQREAHWKEKVARLEQRLSDRILIERAKGVLVQLLKISEEDAYKRLRMQSRQQRRQIRDIAQWVLDTHSMYAPGTNGFGEFLKEQQEREPETRAQQSS